MPEQTFDTIDVLRLEVEAAPDGLSNLVPNANGELGGWGWITPVAGSAMTGTLLPDLSGVPSNPHLLYVREGVGTVASYFYTEPLPVTAGKYAAATWINSALSGQYRVRFEWLDANGALLSSTAQSPYYGVSASARNYGPHLAPANTAYVRLRFDLYANTSGENPSGYHEMRLKQVAVASAATQAELGSGTLPYIPPIEYADVAAETVEIKIVRDELDVGTLTATLVSSTLDPATADLIRPGRRVRLAVVDPTSPGLIFTGDMRGATVNYDLLQTDPEKRAVIQIRAVDVVSRLAQSARPQGVATIASLPWVLEGAGVPWNVNGSGNQIPTATAVSNNENATALDQVAITRDSVLGYAWGDRRGVLNVFDANEMPTVPVATLGEADYNAYGIDVDFDTERCINTVTVKLLTIDATTGETTEVPYGPYADSASVAEWGPRSAEFTVHGIAPANVPAYAAAILSANAVPGRRIKKVTIPVLDVADLPRALFDLYDLVTVENDYAALAADMRITGIEQTITGRKWLITLHFDADGGVAAPMVAPPVQNAPTGAQPFSQAVGQAPVTLAGAAWASVAVAFPAGRFTVAPRVLVAMGNNGGSAQFVARSTGATATGVSLQVYMANGAAFSGTVLVNWHAIQMTPTSADG